MVIRKKVKSYEPSGPSLPELIPVSVARSDFSWMEWQFAGTNLYSWVERGTMRVKCLAPEHNTMTRPRFEPGHLNPESNALTIWRPRLPWL